MKTYESFVRTLTQKGILYIEKDNGQYDENWAMTINIEKIWQDYNSKKISIVDFNNEYASLLMEQQQKISSTIGDSCWYEIEPIIVDELRKSIDVDNSETVYNKIYDVFDKYDVYIDTGKLEPNKNIQ